jgi:DNA processing protein
VLDPADRSPAHQRLLRRWLALQLGLALAPARAVALLRESGDPDRALRAATPKACASARRLDAAVAALRRAGAVAVPFLSRAYPARLAQLADPAPLLLVRGDVTALSAPGVAIVGSRAATVYGLGVARDLGAALGAAGVVVVSGLARGIDAAAHEGALAAGGRTVAVLPCGPDRVYPRSHRGLAERIAGSGAVVTEMPVGVEPRRSFFALRNRLISGMADGLVVVEARVPSGSLLTAAHAANQGIDVFAVPGPISAPTSAGPNRLLRDGAWVLLEPGDVLDVLALGDRGRAAAPAPGPPPSAVLEALAGGPLTRDGLARRLELRPEQLAPELLELELSGRVAEDRDGRLRALPGGRAVFHPGPAGERS